MPWWGLSGMETGTAALKYAELFHFRSSNGILNQFTKMDAPFDTYATEERVSSHTYNNRKYAVGGLTENWMIDEELRVMRQGIRAPTSAPSVAVGAGSTEQICYLRLYDEITGERSPFTGSTTVNGSTSRTWSSLPTEEPGYTIDIPGTTTVNASTTVIGTGTKFRRIRVGDRVAVSSAPTTFVTVTRVQNDGLIYVDTAIGDGSSQTVTVKAAQRCSHIEGWVSIGGLLPRMAWRRQLGVTSLTEAVPLLSMGESSDDAFVQMPRGTVSGFYHDRQLVAGVEGAKDTLYLSEQFYPERFGALTFKTRNGDPITAIATTRDYALVCTPRSSYILQGYTEDDLSFLPSDPGLGCSNHFGIQNIHDVLWIANHEGIFVFNGSWNSVIDDRIDEWQADYARLRRLFDKGYSVHDPERNLYKFIITLEAKSGQTAAEETETVPEGSWVRWAMDSNGYAEPYGGYQQSTMEWVAEYSDVLPQAGGGWSQPSWTNFIQKRVMPWQAYVYYPGEATGFMLGGDTAGNIYKASQSDTDDNMDDFAKRAILVTPFYHVGVPGGDETEAKRLLRFWSYVESEDAAWVVYPLSGDDKAAWARPTSYQNLWYDEIAASELVVVDGGTTTTYMPVTVHSHSKPNNVVGRGFAFAYVFYGSASLAFRGVGGQYGPGRSSRPPKKIVSGG
jgi:hypothetical protein